MTETVVDNVNNSIVIKSIVLKIYLLHKIQGKSQ